MTKKTVTTNAVTEDRPRPVLQLRGATLRHGDRTLWGGLDLAVMPGEFIAVLGGNGSGKSSLLEAILGQQPLTAGSVMVAGKPAGRGSRVIGYIPQRTAPESAVAMRVRDLVRLGVDGHRLGPGIVGSRRARGRVDEVLRQVDAAALANAPVSQLSGGEMQRVRVAEALAGRPALLLCDEPLAALDLGQSQRIVRLIDAQRRAHRTAVLFVTHDINSVLGVADRVLYLAGGAFRLGPPDDVLTSATLTGLYGAPIDVFRAQGRVMVMAATDPGADRHMPNAEVDPHAHHEPHDDHVSLIAEGPAR